MQVILVRDVKNLGVSGEVVNVRWVRPELSHSPGFGRAGDGRRAASGERGRPPNSSREKEPKRLLNQLSC